MPDQATLLVADDDPAVRQSLERALTREGYAVVVVSDVLKEGGRSASGWPRARRWTTAQATLRRQLHETIRKVGDDYGRRHSFNTAIAALMELSSPATAAAACGVNT